ncbi:MAG: hypothetical protein ACTSQS_18075, partial [Promethearchaeota archaeon]
MAKNNFFLLFDALIVFSAGFLVIFGNLQANFFMMVLGIILSIIALSLTLLVTIGTEGESDVDDVAFINALIYPLLVGCVMTIGSWYDNDPVIQSMWLDLGLIMGLFIIFVYVWYLLREKLKGGLSFLELDAIDIDFHSDTDVNKLPKFLLVSVILGTILGLLFVLFKLLYHVLGYNPTVYTFMMIVLVATMGLSFGPRFLSWLKEKLG